MTVGESVGYLQTPGTGFLGNGILEAVPSTCSLAVDRNREGVKTLNVELWRNLASNVQDVSEEF